MNDINLLVLLATDMAGQVTCRMPRAAKYSHNSNSREVNYTANEIWWNTDSGYSAERKYKGASLSSLTRRGRLDGVMKIKKSGRPPRRPAWMNHKTRTDGRATDKKESDNATSSRAFSWLNLYKLYTFNCLMAAPPSPRSMSIFRM